MAAAASTMSTALAARGVPAWPLPVRRRSISTPHYAKGGRPGGVSAETRRGYPQAGGNDRMMAVSVMQTQRLLRARRKGSRR